ncbi:hypothetical protein LG52_33 [Geobacillus kaustophilus]|uniref:Endonuclease n=1 Tax=Geobacillus kaustophilus TaxID=1462 RepID=A0A0D8BTA5_GEOKU|nr:hypothetical protein LG52_33 [Geobacillus kaustophilus]
MISLLHRLTREGDKWRVDHRLFNSREEALEYLKKQQHPSQFKFYSEKLKRGFRSNWEVELAELLAELGIEFLYEPKRFHFRAERESYLPDFYLPEFNCWIEVKGYMDKRSLRRIKLFRKYYGKQYAFILYEKEERELILKDPSILFVLLEVAQQELERRRRK